MTADCRHRATLSVSGEPGIRWCPTCDTYFTERADGTLEPRR